MKLDAITCHYNSHSCDGCSKKNKPSDCKSDGCGRCCQGQCSSKSNELEREFLLTLLERSFLPFVYIELGEEKIIIYKSCSESSALQISSYAQIIDKFHSLGYLTLDFGDELDEYSYEDYASFDASELTLGQKYSQKRGSIAITEKCYKQFINNHISR